MRRLGHDAANLRNQVQQFDLFGPPRTSGDLPMWRTLPDETRRAVMSLMMRLILDHGPGDRRPAEKEAVNDV
jgi:hypothetical protein